MAVTVEVAHHAVVPEDGAGDVDLERRALRAQLVDGEAAVEGDVVLGLEGVEEGEPQLGVGRQRVASRSPAF